MWRSVFQFLSNSRGLRGITTRSGVARQVALRFVAGETLEDAIIVCKRLAEKGIGTEIDHLGENVSDVAQARVATEVYLNIASRVAKLGLDSHVAIKPTQMGMGLDDELCRQNVEQVVARAEELNGFVWLDMEGRSYTTPTLELYQKIRQQHSNVGVAIQSYLYRSHDDVAGLLEIGGSVRLCKGAYLEPPDVAYPKKVDVDSNYMALTEMLLGSGQFHAIATHDERMIQNAIRYASENGIDKNSYEFQMLYGIRRDLQERLREQGYKVRMYIPYGVQWYPYLMRRLAERPANLVSIVSNIAREAAAKP